VKLQQIKERAIEGEVMLLTHRQESSVKPMEQRLQELEKLCAFASQIVPGGDTDLSLFKDQLKQAVETYKVSTDEQIDQIRKEVKELNQLTLIPSLHSQCPMSPQLIMVSVVLFVIVL
jgi:E3 ubiquitin-protein ligase TTC3